MIRCTECGSAQLNGALFCGECGSFLLQEPGQTTAVLPFSEFANRPPPPPLTGDQLALEANPNPRQVTFVIPSSRRRLKVQLVDVLRIGRLAADSTPEINLESDGGAEKGVSRAHALIRSVKGGIVLEDLASTNGTMLNTYHLPAHEPYPLHSGDEVRFGELLVHVFFD
jgi:pSer/pThr/pTyr-binding forkhead associated (FHA) protein